MLVSSPPLHPIPSHPPKKKLHEETKCREAAEQRDKCYRSQRLPVCQAGGCEQQSIETPTQRGLSHKEFIFLQTKERCSRIIQWLSVAFKRWQPPPHVGNGLPHGHRARHHPHDHVQPRGISSYSSLKEENLYSPDFLSGLVGWD